MGGGGEGGERRDEGRGKKRMGGGEGGRGKEGTFNW